MFSCADAWKLKEETSTIANTNCSPISSKLKGLIDSTYKAFPCSYSSDFPVNFTSKAVRLIYVHVQPCWRLRKERKKETTTIANTKCCLIFPNVKKLIDNRYKALPCSDPSDFPLNCTSKAVRITIDSVHA